MPAARKNTKIIRIGGITIGGASPIAVQSMTTADPYDFEAVLSQVRRIEAAGGDIVRMTVPDEKAAAVFSVLKHEGVKIPLVADIHFDHKAAIAAAMSGADKIRINPGNIGNADKVREVATTCKILGLPIRIGVNAGSLDKKLLQKYGSPCAEALAESAFEEAEALERFGFSDIVISIKSSDVETMAEAARIVSKNSDYPLHLGVTEAGDAMQGRLKSAAGIGALLIDGIGDTIRVSLTEDPVEEIPVAYDILQAVGARISQCEYIACPSCGRTQYDIQEALHQIKARTQHLKGVKIGVMGCIVNGPGEMADAHYGYVGQGAGKITLYKGREVMKRDIKQADAVDELVRLIKANGDWVEP